MSDPHSPFEWPTLLQLHYPSSGEKDTGGVEDYSVMAQTPPCPALQVHAFRKWPASYLHSFPTARAGNQIYDRNERGAELALWTKLFRVSFVLRSESSNPAFISKRCPSFSSAAFNRPHSYFLSPSSPLLSSKTENVRWANAIHRLTKGKLGLLLQGSDRLEPEARFSFSHNPLTSWSALCLFFLIYSHTNTKLNSAWGNLCLLWR